MIVLVSSKIRANQIAQSLGTPEYSYYFLLREFAPALTKFAQVEEVDGPREAVERYRVHRSQGHDVVFLSISPPHQTPLDLECPTVSLFAWEFDTVPHALWNTDTREDWRFSLSHIDGAIATSQFAANAVRSAVGPEYPIAAIPAPLWDGFSDLGDDTGEPPPLGPHAVPCGALVLDSHWYQYSANGLVRKPEARLPMSWSERLIRTRSALRDLVGAFRPEVQTEPPPAEKGWAPWARHLDEIGLVGVTYLAVLAPGDARKNWVDVVTAFCWAFREIDDATLILKMSDNDHDHYQTMVMTLFSRVEPFKCRIVTIFGYVSDDAYRAIVRGSTFAVNASTAEGLCLPLMEAMCAGKPVIAPRHTALLDYIDESVAFVVDGADQPMCWPHDPTGKLLAKARRLNWDSLRHAFKTSYAVRKHESARYASMSIGARKRMREYCSLDAVAQKLQAHLSMILRSRSNAA